MLFWIIIGVIVAALVTRSSWRRRHRGSGVRGDYKSERAGRATVGRDGGRGFFSGNL